MTMTRQTKKPNRVEQVENRLDRFEQALIASSQTTQKNIDRLSTEIGFLLKAVQGHISQSTPPAHSAD